MRERGGDQCRIRNLTDDAALTENECSGDLMEVTVQSDNGYRPAAMHTNLLTNLLQQIL